MSPRSRPGRALAAIQNRVLANMATGRGLAAINPSRVLRARQDQLDSRLFGGGFETMVWWALKQTIAVEIERTSQLRIVLEAAVDPEALGKLSEDTRYLVAAAEDIDRDVERAIQADQPLMEEELDWLLVRQDIAIQALSLLVLVNERLDIGIRQGVDLAFMQMKVMMQQADVEQLRRELRALDAALQAAAGKVEREWQKAIIGASVNVLTVLNPAMGLAARGSLELGQTIVNWALSDPPESISDVDTVVARRSLERLSKEISDSRQASRATVAVANAPARANPVIGFVFDARAVIDSHEEADRIAAAMERTSDALDDALADLEQAQPMIEALRKAVERWEGELARADLDASSTRRRLDALRREHEYYPAR